jgi:uncharacterized membrane protein (DUF106 family)
MSRRRRKNCRLRQRDSRESGPGKRINMWIFNSFVNTVFELILTPFRNMSPWYGMTVVSFLTGFLMLFIFRFTSNQEGIRRTKNRIKAHLLELRLFKDSMSQS